MQFQVPQFIDVEDQVVGSLTWRQFLYLAAGGGVLVVLWFVLVPLAWIVVAFFVAGLAAAAAFLKVGGRSFFPFLGSVLGFAVRARQYIWQQSIPAARREPAKHPTPEAPQADKPSVASKIRELAWSLAAKKEQPR